MKQRYIILKKKTSAFFIINRRRKYNPVNKLEEYNKKYIIDINIQEKKLFKDIPVKKLPFIPYPLYLPISKPAFL